LHWVDARRCGKRLGRNIGAQTLKEKRNACSSM
jgi:hypothetical protein